MEQLIYWLIDRLDSQAVAELQAGLIFPMFWGHSLCCSLVNTLIPTPTCHSMVDLQDPDDEDAGGCILAHSMGLGKSLQTIAFLHTFFAYYPDQRSLLLVPSNVVHNWVEEFHHWLPQGRPETDDELTPSKVKSA